MTGRRLIVGVIVMGIAVPLTICFLLRLRVPSQFFTIAATTFLAWGVAHLLASVLERPRLENRSATQALRDDIERRREE
jgi:hypothetical protein